MHGRAGLPLEAGHPHHVVQVRVCQPDRDRGDVERRDPVGDEIRLLPGVDDRAGAACLVHDDVAVLGELAVGDRNDLHDATEARSFSRSAATYFSTAIAAVVASPTAVVIWRGSWLRTSPAANRPGREGIMRDRKSKRLNSSHPVISYALFCLKKKKKNSLPSRQFHDRSTG